MAKQRTNKKRDVLGKGIRALLQNIDQEEVKQSTVNDLSKTDFKIPIEQIEVNPFQPRTDFDPAALADLAQSIQLHGIIQPLTVRRLGNKSYQLIAGERRLRASKLAGLQEVPAYIRTADDQAMLELALIENVERQDLNPIEVAVTYQRLLDECSLTQDNLAKRLGKSRPYITHYLSLLRLPPNIQLALKNKSIRMGHARNLASLPSADIQLTVFEEIIQKSLSVRQVEKLVKAWKDKLKHQKNRRVSSGKPKLPVHLQRVQDNLMSQFETRVTVKRTPQGSGHITLTFSSDEDLNRILELLEG